jgi:hypothetical protein
LIQDQTAPQRQGAVSVWAQVAESQRLQIFDEICFLRWRQIQAEMLIIVIDHVKERRRAAVMEIRRMLPESA